MAMKSSEANESCFEFFSSLTRTKKKYNERKSKCSKGSNIINKV